MRGPRCARCRDLGCGGGHSGETQRTPWLERDATLPRPARGANRRGGERPRGRNVQWLGPSGPGMSVTDEVFDLLAGRHEGDVRPGGAGAAEGWASSDACLGVDASHQGQRLASSEDRGTLMPAARERAGPALWIRLEGTDAARGSCRSVRDSGGAKNLERGRRQRGRLIFGGAGGGASRALGRDPEGEIKNRSVAQAGHPTGRRRAAAEHHEGPRSATGASSRKRRRLRAQRKGQGGCGQLPITRYEAARDGNVMTSRFRSTSRVAREKGTGPRRCFGTGRRRCLDSALHRVDSSPERGRVTL